MEAVYYAARANLRRLLMLHPAWTRGQLAQATGMSKSWVDKWKRRLLSAPLNDEQVLRGLSRAPHHPPPRLDSQVVDRLLEIRDDPKDALGRPPGPKAILYYLKRISCGNRPPRVAFPTLPSLPPVPDLVNPDAWLSRVKGQHLVRRVNRQGFVKVDLYHYYISSKLASWPTGDLIHPGNRAEFAGGLSAGVSSLAAAQGLTSTGIALSGVSRTHAAGSLDSTAFACFRKRENPLRLSSHLTRWWEASPLTR
jgi:hypothetical protein